jgi:hypothetical protein
MNLKAIEAFLNPDNTSLQLGEEFVAQMKDFFQSENFTRAYPSLFRLLWHSAAPCSPTGINEDSLLKVVVQNDDAYDCDDDNGDDKHGPRNAGGEARSGIAPSCSAWCRPTLASAAHSTLRTHFGTRPTRPCSG